MEITDGLPIEEIKFGPKKIGKVLIICGDEFLLLKRTKKWELPGGRADNDEGPKEAAIRETKQETGIQLEANLLDENQHVSEKQLVHRQQIITTFIVHLEEKPEITLSPEHIAYLWIKKKEALKMNLREQTREALSNINFSR